MKGRLGLADCTELLLDSPFDYTKQSILYLGTDLPDPSTQTALFVDNAINRVKEILDILQGRTFILFTSYSTLEDTYNRLSVTNPNLVFMKQGDMPRWQMIKEFRKKRNAVLFGTNTFWQGVDIPGKALECVIIFKLPFAVPDNPVTESKIELIKLKGEDPFKNYQLPQAIIMLKQGFGRLIRTQTDYGVVVILDSRIKTRHYGKLFLDSLPKCKVTNKIKDIEDFFIEKE
jgi:ATP-dependent DNA helicase DinG